jgi:outer membrane receptor protein involved in Fe transport
VGNTAETVTVEGAAPIVEGTTDQLSQTFDEKQVASVPLGNSYDSFVLFSPGVATVGSGGFENNNGAELSINGQRGRSNNYQIDGQNNNDNTIGGASFFFGNQDAISELQVVTNYDAEYGRNMGGVVNYVTKNGTNAFHGTGFEFWQGDHFDSLQNQEKNPLFGFCAQGENPSDGCAVPVVPQFVENQFGGTFGGPIKRDKIWFFGSTNWQRNRSSGAPVVAANTLTPTANGLQQLQAAFPNSAGVTLLNQWAPATLAVGNPKFVGLTSTTGACGTPNVTCVTDQVDATGTAFPCTSPGNGCVPIEFGTIQRFLSQPFNDREYTGRVDFQLTSKDRFFTRYNFQQQTVGNTPLGGALGSQGVIYSVYGRNQQIGLDETHSFTPTMLNQVRFSYSRSISEFDKGGFPTCTLQDQGACPPFLAFNDPTFLGVGQLFVFPQGRLINVYELQDNASWVHGKQVIKFGGSYDRQRSPNYGLFEQNGNFAYTSFNDLIANQSTVFSQVAYGQPILRFKENDAAFYFQDDWRIKDNLTLNLGLRWEFYQQAGNILHDESVAQQAGPNHLWDPTLPLSQTTVPKLPNQYKNYGPVVGFAYTPRFLPSLFGADKTVIRGGFRIAYDFAYYNLASNIEGTAPFTNLATIPDPTGLRGAPLPNIPSLTGSAIAAALFPIVQQNPADPGFATELQFGKNFGNPYSEQWNLGIQRQITNRVGLEIRYVGNHDVKNFQEINGNPDIAPLFKYGFQKFVPAGLTPCTTPGAPGSSGNDNLPKAFQSQVGYANCNFSRVIQYANTGFSVYHGLQSQLRLQNYHGFTGNLSYTYSHTIDNASEAFSSLSGSGSLFNLAQNPYDLNRGERANSAYDYPHVLSFLGVYDLPFGKGQSGLRGHVLGGWSINGTYRYTSGQPWTVVQTNGQGLCDPANFTAGGLDTCRPILNNASAPFTSVGTCTNPALSDCGISDLATGPSTLSAEHWIINDVNAALFFGSPFLGVGRNTERGQPVNTVNMSVFKNTKVSERVTIQLQADAFNLFNHQWLGIPAVNADAGPQGFGSLKFNPNGGPDGGFGTANIITDGIGRRRLQLGAKIIF